VKAKLSFILYAVSLGALGYWVPREEFLTMFVLYGICWGAYAILAQRLYSLTAGLGLAALLRLMLLFCLPWLSDDYYRFIFDGQLLAHFINPYAQVPVDAVHLLDAVPEGLRVELIERMNSPMYHSVYPPLNQLFFYLAVMGTDKIIVNVILLRSTIIVFDLFAVFLLHKLVLKFSLPSKCVWLYAFNPLVIVELTGNLHFEGLVLCGLLLCLYGLTQANYPKAAIGWAFAVAVKLTPLMLGPLLLKYNFKSFKFWLVSGIIVVLTLAPLFWSENRGFWTSLSLYQKNFEFNASVYYLLNLPISFLIGYNPIAVLGPILSLTTLGLILLISTNHPATNPRTLAGGMVAVYLVYLLLQPIVHPWYLIPAFGISLLTPYRSFLAWTALVFLSYGAYASSPVQEKGYLLLIEYGVLLIFIIRDWKKYWGSKIIR
jgi:alpha-1,6-mannosyltransferase